MPQRNNKKIKITHHSNARSARDNAVHAVVSLFALILLGACSSPPENASSVKINRLKAYVYQPDIRQGNTLADKKLSQLKTGMTKRKVRFLLGSPPIDDPFHKDRWDYVYTYKRKGVLTEHRSVSLFFIDDKLVKTQGIDDLLPLSASNEKSGNVVVEVPTDRSDGSLFGRF